MTNNEKKLQLSDKERELKIYAWKKNWLNAKLRK